MREWIMTGRVSNAGDIQSHETRIFDYTLEVEGLVMSLHNCEPFVTKEATFLVDACDFIHLVR